MPSFEDLLRAAPELPRCTPSISLRQQLSITLETLQIIREELRLAREALAAQQLQPDRGETVWYQWCAAWHDADPRLTARRERQLTRHVVDHLWGAIDRGVSPELRGDMMMTAATLAIRAHWPA